MHLWERRKGKERKGKGKLVYSLRSAIGMENLFKGLKMQVQFQGVVCTGFLEDSVDNNLTRYTRSCG